jgi:hypothetical protein
LQIEVWKLQIVSQGNISEGLLYCGEGVTYYFWSLRVVDVYNKYKKWRSSLPAYLLGDASLQKQEAILSLASQE